MTDETTMNGEESRQQGPQKGSNMLRAGRWMELVRSALSGTRLFDRAVRSLSKRVDVRLSYRQSFFSSLLLKTTQALMLAGIRCAGAGGGGPGH